MYKMSHSRAHGIRQLMSVHAPSNQAGELRSIDGQAIPGPVSTSPLPPIREWLSSTTRTPCGKEKKRKSRHDTQQGHQHQQRGTIIPRPLVHVHL